MSQTCRQCLRINPDEALYCHYDGVALDGQANGRPIHVALQSFPVPFVFPTGDCCRNFNELALTCQRRWETALAMLGDGFFEAFFGTIGRTDLAITAREAARNPDRDRGLDDLLGKLPSDILTPAALWVDPMEVNLGVMAVGESRSFEIQLKNEGMRLLHGTASCADCVWLTLGDPPSAQHKLLQCETDMVLKVQVRGQYVCGNVKPLEGEIVIDTNGGMAVVRVRAEVPVKPFPDGVLAGAMTPRQAAEKAKASPREAALLMEQGRLAEWYAANGWIYPVQGPSATGLGAVQQFYEALGLVTPPPVEVSDRAIHFHAGPDGKFEHVVKATALEKRPIHAHAVTDQPWLKIGRAKLVGRTALIRVAVAEIPARPGETIEGRVIVTANGNQQFPIDVTLTIDETYSPEASRERERPVDILQPGTFVPDSEPSRPVEASRKRERPVPILPPLRSLKPVVPILVLLAASVAALCMTPTLTLHERSRQTVQPCPTPG